MIQATSYGGGVTRPEHNVAGQMAQNLGMSGPDTTMRAASTVALWPAVAIGAMAGASLRYGTTTWWGGDDRIATLAVNVAGSFVLGVLTALVGALRVSPRTNALLATGFCGALTTFSTFAVELAESGRHGSAAGVVAYLGASVVLGLGAARAGLRSGRWASTRWVSSR